MSNFFGGVVLVDPATGLPYKAGTAANAENPVGWMAGSVVLIDPATGLPYRIGA